MATSRSFLLGFNKTLYELLTILEEAFPNDPMVHTQREPLQLALKMCSSMAITKFMQEMMTHGKEVDDRNEHYFLEKCQDNPSTTIGGDLWRQMDRRLKDTVWDHVQKMKELAELYYRSM